MLYIFLFHFYMFVVANTEARQRKFMLSLLYTLFVFLRLKDVRTLLALSFHLFSVSICILHNHLLFFFLCLL